MPKKKSKKNYSNRSHMISRLGTLFGIIVGISIVFGIAFFVYQYVTIERTKTYTNNFYHFKLDIPNNWMITEKVSPDGFPSINLSAPDYSLQILVNGDVAGTRIDKELPQPDIHIGTYVVERDRYVSGAQIFDYAGLPQIPNQRPIQMQFTVADFQHNNPKLLTILKTFAYTQKELPTSHYVTYTLPHGWRVQHDDFQYVSLISPDYQIQPQVGYLTNGILIVISRTTMPSNKTIQDLMNDFSDKNNDQQPTTVDGIPGFTRHSNWDIHAQIFMVIQNGYLWTITVDTRNLAQENQYRALINAFINSIHLKTNIY